MLLVVGYRDGAPTHHPYNVVDPNVNPVVVDDPAFNPVIVRERSFNSRTFCAELWTLVFLLL